MNDLLCRQAIAYWRAKATVYRIKAQALADIDPKASQEGAREADMAEAIVIGHEWNLLNVQGRESSPFAARASNFSKDRKRG